MGYIADLENHTKKRIDDEKHVEKNIKPTIKSNNYEKINSIVPKQNDNNNI